MVLGYENLLIGCNKELQIEKAKKKMINVGKVKIARVAE